MLASDYVRKNVWNNCRNCISSSCRVPSYIKSISNIDELEFVKEYDREITLGHLGNGSMSVVMNGHSLSFFCSNTNWCDAFKEGYDNIFTEDMFVL